MTQDERQAELKKRFNRVNPFQKLETEAQALEAAKCAAGVAGYMVLSYGLQMAVAAARGADLFGTPAVIALPGFGVMAVLAGFLAWRIWTRQPLWAAIVIAVWFAAELVAKVILTTQGPSSSAFAVMFVFLTIAAVLGVRGAHALRRMRVSSVAA